MTHRAVGSHAAVLLFGVLLTTAGRIAEAEEGPDNTGRRFTLHPIGSVSKTEEGTTLVLDKEYQPGLLRCILNRLNDTLGLIGNRPNTRRDYASLKKLTGQPSGIRIDCLTA